ncbi:hypothetical protein CFR73_09895 [Novacetimonas maltaceti]|uniref:DUF4054 domain-containing protein n=1 Tax=Novacetimonas maltaceti TaxID=1203393 RepID=A0A2S3W430_9PROT|nr:hypothetical protein KMAL_08010 [Novacetimonas maltaceti]PYD59886.1 hypothetical protein CFR73_09895 [Novacetimonas maltaceti]
MSGGVAFDYATWAQRFPLLAAQVGATQAAAYYAQATLILSPRARTAQDMARRAVLLNLLVAHVAQLELQVAQGNGLVGRVSDATQGSITVRTQMEGQGASAAWFNQTSYGAQFWAMSRRLRLARYVPGWPQRAAVWP